MQRAAGVGFEVCEAATTRDLAYHCANGYYHQLSTWVDTLEARLRGGKPVAEAGDLNTTTWTHDVCVGAPLEAGCLPLLDQAQEASRP